MPTDYGGADPQGTVPNSAPLATTTATVPAAKSQGATPQDPLNFQSVDAPVYTEQAAAAQDAYNQALNNVNQKRSTLYNQAGFLQNPDGSMGGVDGGNLTGQYQQLEKTQGQTLEGIHESDASRNIGGQGIGDQNTENARYGDAVQSGNFFNTLGANDQELDSEKAGASSTLQNTLLNLMLSDQSDLQKYGFPNAPPAAGSGSGTGSGGGTVDKSGAAPLGGGTQTKPGGIVTDASGGYFDPSTGQYYTAGKGPAAALAASAANQKLNLSAPTAALKPAAKSLVKAAAGNAYTTSKNKKG